MKKPIYFIVFIFMTILLLSVIQVSVANSISTTGLELSTAQTQIKTYQRENALLKEKYLKTASLTNINQKAKKLGFVSNATTLSLSSPMPLALK